MEGRDVRVMVRGLIQFDFYLTIESLVLFLSKFNNPIRSWRFPPPQKQVSNFFVSHFYLYLYFLFRVKRPRDSEFDQKIVLKQE